VPALSVVLILLMASTPAGAFDGKRKGFAFGFGIGAAPVSRMSADIGDASFSTGTFGVGTEVIAGWGIDEQYVVAFDVNLSSYRSSYGASESRELTQAILSLSLYRYFNKELESYFLMGGAGLYRATEPFGVISISICFNCPPRDPEPDIPEEFGPGVIVGGGRQIRDKFQIGLYVSAGRPQARVRFPGPSDPRVVTTDSFHVNLLFTWINF